MELALPLPADELPENLRRFGDPKAPGPARTMAAKGLVPVRGNDLVTLLIQLGADPDATISKAATETLSGLPEQVLLGACGAKLHPAILDGIAKRYHGRDDVLEVLVMNHAVADVTIARVAKDCGEMVSEAIAVNQQRFLGYPKIAEALYLNANTRMSTADRIVELCARNGVELEGVASFKDHVEAIQGELIPEPTPEPIPEDVDFQEACDADDDEEAVEEDPADEEKEKVKDAHLPLFQRIGNMKKSAKIRFAIVGNAAARSILVRDPNKQVARAAIESPKMTTKEAADIASSRQVPEEILRVIANRKKWTGNYDVKRNLIFNPKTPVGVSMKFLSHMRDNDLKALTRSRTIPGAIKRAAQQRYDRKTKGRRG